MSIKTPVVFSELLSERTEKAKQEVLKKYQSDFLLFVLKQTYDPYVKYGMKQIPEYVPVETETRENQENYIIDFLEQVSSGSLRGNAAINELQCTLNRLEEGYANILCGILIKKQDIGMAAKSLNATFGKDFIPLTPYMRCSTISKIDNIVYPAIIQKKADGAYLNVIVENNDVTFITRTGNQIEIPKLRDAILKHIDSFSGYVLHGEVLIETYLDNKNRSLTNGKVNSLIARESTIESFKEKIETAKTPQAKEKLQNELSEKYNEWEQLQDNAYIECWDIIPVNDWKFESCTIQYANRLNTLTELFSKTNIKELKLIPGKVVHSWDEASDYFRELISLGEEGAVLKNFKAQWKNNTSTEQIKLKPVYSAEFRVIGWEYGDENNYFNQGIGRLIAETEDKKLQIKVGGGFKLNERGLQNIDDLNPQLGVKVIDGFNFNEYNGKIIEIEYYGVTISKDGDGEKYALQFPQFKGIRHDKTEADTFEYIMDANIKV